MSKLTKKHDPLARKFLTDTTVAKEFLMAHLAPEILAKVNLDSLQIESGSYVEEDLAAYYSDLVYRLELKENKGSIYIYTLVEHQSKAEKLMPLRILKYQLAIIQNHLDKYKGKTELPIVVSLVFYNGEDSPYPYPLDIANLFADVETYRQAPLGAFRLVDLTVTEDNELLQHGKLALLEILLKHIRERDFTNAIASIIQALKVSLTSEISNSLLNSAFSYLMSAKEVEEIQQLVEQININIPDLKENIMTYAEELMQKGRQEGEQRGKQLGKQEGKQETQLEIALKMLKKGLDEAVVAELTELPLSQIKTLH